MMEAASEETKTTTTAAVTLNVGYPTSWQGVLKIAKCVFLFCCLVCSAIILNNHNKYLSYFNYSQAPLNYCLAIAVIGFVTELVVFILYIAGVNKKWSSNAVCSILMMIYHIIMLIMMFAACILMTGGTGAIYGKQTVAASYAAAQAYNAFGIFTIIGFSLDVYFNIVWMRGGPELAALSIPGTA